MGVGGCGATSIALSVPLGATPGGAGPLAIERQAHRHARPLAHPAADRNLAAVQPDQAFDDGKSEPGAAMAAIVGCARLKVRLADARQIFVADADAIVLDHKADACGLGAGADRDLAAPVGKADRIRQKVEQNLIERALVGDHVRQVAGCRSFKPDASLAGPQRQDIAATGNGQRRIERLRGDLEVAGLDFRHVEDAVDHRQQMVPGIVDQAGVFAATLGVEHQQGFLLQHFGEADDGVERRPQFVAHGGEEAAFGGVGALGVGARLLERLLLPFALADLAQHRDHFAAVRIVRGAARLFERPAAHFDPDEFRRRSLPGVDGVAPDAKFDRSAFADRRRHRRVPSDRRDDR